MFALDTKVLVVDDMKTMRMFITRVCKDLGFTDITEAVDGALAWSMINSGEKQFGLIISDWNMPNMSGLDLLIHVRGDARFSKTPFLMVTAESEEEQANKAVEAGIDGFVLKPLDKDRLIQNIEEVYKKYS
jgi:two-component system chemotaxis response regulator CheY